jgi:hypothetical protein
LESIWRLTAYTQHKFSYTPSTRVFISVVCAWLKS